MEVKKNEEYYMLGRPEMLSFIPRGCKVIVDAGCGSGYFGKLLKSELNAEVWGIEIETEAAKNAGRFLDYVMCGDMLESVKSLPDNSFDCIVFNDSLEHLTDPYSVLSAIRGKLKQNAYVVASIPNVRYIKNLKELIIDKDWKYSHEGILDSTHFRFFTKKSMIRMFEEHGYSIDSITGINPVKKKIIFAILNLISFGILSDSKYLQFAITAKKF